MSRRSAPRKAVGTLIGNSQQSGKSLVWDYVNSVSEVRDQMQEDRGRIRRWNGLLMALSYHGLMWPHRLRRGDSEWPGLFFMTGRAAIEKNKKYEDRFMSGKDERLWRYSPAYSRELNTLTRMVTERLIHSKGSHVEEEIKKVFDEAGLEYLCTSEDGQEAGRL
jgi:hypothetical protein